MRGEGQAGHGGGARRLALGAGGGAEGARAGHRLQRPRAHPGHLLRLAHGGRAGDALRLHPPHPRLQTARQTHAERRDGGHRGVSGGEGWVLM